MGLEQREKIMTFCHEVICHAAALLGVKGRNYAVSVLRHGFKTNIKNKVVGVRVMVVTAVLVGWDGCNGTDVFPPIVIT